MATARFSATNGDSGCRRPVLCQPISSTDFFFFFSFSHYHWYFGHDFDVFYAVWEGRWWMEYRGGGVWCGLDLHWVKKTFMLVLGFHIPSCFGLRQSHIRTDPRFSSLTLSQYSNQKGKFLNKSSRLRVGQKRHQVRKQDNLLASNLKVQSPARSSFQDFYYCMLRSFFTLRLRSFADKFQLWDHESSTALLDLPFIFWNIYVYK